MAQNEVPITKYHEISRKYGDPWIWGIFIMLMIISIIESYSASSREVAKVGLYAPLIKQCLFLGVCALLAIGLLHVNYNRTWFLYLAVPILAIFSVVSLLYVMKFGDLINGARRSMTIIPGLPSIQPSGTVTVVGVP
jgi:cell division protein FtsW